MYLIQDTDYYHALFLIFSMFHKSDVVFWIFWCVLSTAQCMDEGGLACSNKTLIVDDNAHNKTACAQINDCTYHCPRLSLALQNLNFNLQPTVISITNNETILNVNGSSSNHVIINDTKHVTITGLSPYSTVICANHASISCINCANVVIQNLYWIGCGMLTPNYVMPAGIFFLKSSNIVIQNCSFQKSSVHALGFSTGTTLSIISSSFIGNNGSALYALNSKFDLSGEIVFSNNQGVSGAAIFSEGSYTNWLNADINFTNNSVKTYGGAVYAGITPTCYDLKPFEFIQTFSNSNVVFNNNHADITGNCFYFSLDVNCEKQNQLDSLFKYVKNFTYLPSMDFRKEIGTTVFNLNLFSPAKCTNKTCSINDIMLGEEIVIPTNATGYYKETVSEVSRFLIKCTKNCEKYSIGGSEVVLVQYNALKGFHIKGKMVVPDQATNITLQIVTIGSNALASNRVMDDVHLTVILSPCKPGFAYNHTMKICQCYSHNSKIVKCSDEDSASIKQGYWFGYVNGQATTTFCPSQYCDFTSCDDCISYCDMPKSKDGQCREHRTGIACGKCKPGYVLPFDSIVCVESDECHPAITALVIILIVFYWLATVVLIIIFMNFPIQIGYAYGIIYFYSIVDLLYYNLANNSEIVFITILSGFARLTPKFLGTLCLTNNEDWSGIDQQFFHYVHPIAVSLILLGLTIAARYSVRLSHYISRSIIRAICLILLLAYTSVASTSLRLLQPQFFDGINEVYTYSSPDNKYFRGRHAFYGVIALVFGVVVVIGFPLVLLLEPFLSRKIYFARLKPILDQFQGCYKDQYRHFAGYYLLCRLVIMIVVFTSGSFYLTLFIVKFLCIIITIIHGWALPYRSKLLNGLDLIILLTAILVVGYNTSYLPDSLDIIVYVVMVIFPLLCFIVFRLVWPVIKVLMARQKRSHMTAMEYEALLGNTDINNDDFLDSRDDSGM